MNHTQRAQQKYEDANAKSQMGSSDWTMWSELPVAERARLTAIELRHDLNLKAFNEVLPDLTIAELKNIQAQVEIRIRKLNLQFNPFS